MAWSTMMPQACLQRHVEIMKVIEKQLATAQAAKGGGASKKSEARRRALFYSVLCFRKIRRCERAFSKNLETEERCAVIAEVRHGMLSANFPVAR